LKILLHTCCAPCTIYPLTILRQENFEVMGFYYRHNIHPYTECLKRQEALEQYAQKMNFRLIIQDGYELEKFLQNVVFRETMRCRLCYYERLKATAHIAKRGHFDYFSSTLLYSKFQKHTLIQSIGEAVGKSIGIPFLYRDFREGWKEGIEKSKQLNLYRQQYCGCIYSEKDRYYHP
jgi:hypothetical protein